MHGSLLHRTECKHVPLLNLCYFRSHSGHACIGCEMCLQKEPTMGEKSRRKKGQRPATAQERLPTPMGSSRPSTQQGSRPQTLQPVQRGNPQHITLPGMLSWLQTIKCPGRNSDDGEHGYTCMLASIPCLGWICFGGTDQRLSSPWWFRQLNRKFVEATLLVLSSIKGWPARWREWYAVPPDCGDTGTTWARGVKLCAVQDTNAQLVVDWTFTTMFVGADGGQPSQHPIHARRADEREICLHASLFRCWRLVRDFSFDL